MRLANYVEHDCKPRAVKMLSRGILICNGSPLGRRMRKRWRCSIRINSGLRAAKKICHYWSENYLSRPMPKPIARRKTKKAVAKRFKITGRGKVLRSHSSRRHLLSSKSAKRKRRLSKAALVDKTDVARIKANLPFA
jgi:large subunit ribosomal protein L35